MKTKHWETKKGNFQKPSLVLGGHQSMHVQEIT